MMCAVNAASRQHPQSGPATLGSVRARVNGAAQERFPAAGPPESPLATTARARTWRDPRLLVGLAIVAVCVLLGARLLASADDTISVWSVRHDMPAGSVITAADLQRQELRFDSAALAARYVSATDPVPDGTVLAREVAAGELLPRAALAADTPEDLVEVPIALASEAVPATLRSGELVDVWVTREDASGELRPAVRVLEQVRVMALPQNGGALGPSATRQVVIGIPAEDESVVATALGQLSGGTPLIVRRG
jgi:hypothetical protein